MKRRYKSQAIMADINITPFTDVILVLLIIFMVATPLMFQSSIEVKLPASNSKSIIEDQKPVYITVTAEGIIYLENKVLTNKELKIKIDSLMKKDRDLKVILAADEACRFQDVVRVIDTLKELGVKGLNIAARQGETF